MLNLILMFLLMFLLMTNMLNFDQSDWRLYENIYIYSYYTVLSVRGIYINLYLKAFSSL